MVAVLRLKSVYMTVHDVGAARRFYEDALDLKLKFADGERWAEFDTGGTGFALACEAESAAPDATVMVLEVDSLVETQRKIELHGGKTIGVRDMGSHGMVATMADPEGLIFQLFCRAAPKT